MDNGPITQEFVSKVLLLIEQETCFKKESISFEIQDDFKFLLISISIDEFPMNATSSIFKKIGNLLNRFIPGRKGEYSWMVNFTSKEKVIDSYFGGDLDSPDSGL